MGKINITRKRWVLTREDCGIPEILCGTVKNRQFKSIYDIGNTEIRTYSTQARALMSVKNDWHFEEYKYKAVEVTETIKQLD